MYIHKDEKEELLEQNPMVGYLPQEAFDAMVETVRQEGGVVLEDSLHWNGFTFYRTEAMPTTQEPN